MSVLRSRDFLAGAVALVLGVFVIAVTSDQAIGSPRRMGPGFFPLGLGAILSVIGVAIMASAARSHEALPRLDLRAVILIPSAIVAFALLLPRLGFAPAGAVVIVISALAGGQARPRSIGALIVVLVPAIWLLFAIGLGIPIPFVAWRF